MYKKTAPIGAAFRYQCECKHHQSRSLEWSIMMSSTFTEACSNDELFDGNATDVNCAVCMCIKYAFISPIYNSFKVKANFFAILSFLFLTM